jgi:hypothetical protein
MVWYGLIFLSLCTGLLRPPWWTMFVWPAASMGVGVSAVMTEEPNYDMHGFGYFVGGVAAVLCLVAWLLGRGVAAVSGARPKSG